MLAAGSTSSKRLHRFDAKRRSASTLIELLVVIAIIAILISVLLPSLKRSIQLASATICQVHLREIGHGVMMYRYENEGWLPIAGNGPTKSNSVTAGVDVAGAAAGATTAAQQPQENQSWFVKLFPTYLQEPSILACPDDPFGFRITRARHQLREPEVAEFASYGLNNFMLTANGGILANLDRNRPDRTSETILLCDLGPDEMRYSAQRTVTTPGPQRNGGMTAWGDSFDPYSGRPANPWVTSRHNHGINIVTVSGGVRHVRTDDILRAPILREYPSCAAGGCPLCKELKWFHYTFARYRLYWWTGSLPKE